MSADENASPSDLGQPSPRPSAHSWLQHRVEVLSLLDVLRTKDQSDGRLTSILESALQVASNPLVKDRLALAAHNVREFMRMLPLCFRADWTWAEDKRRPALYDKFKAFRDKTWDKHSPGVGGPDSELHYKELHAGMKGLVDWFDNEFRPLRETLQDTVQSFSPNAESLTTSELNQQTDDWLEHYRFFVSICHHQVQASDSEFGDRLCAVARLLLHWITPRAVADTDVIDRLIAKYEQSASPEAFARARELINNRDVRHAYFFNRISSAEWMEPLAEAGFFCNPPEPQREAAGTALRAWPESQYLARVAGSLTSQQQEEAAKLFKGFLGTDNIYVRWDIADALLKLEPKHAARVVDRLVAWLPRLDQYILPEKLGKLLVHLAKGGFSQEALRLLRGLLAVPQSSTPEDSEDTGRFRFRPEPLFAEHIYDQIVTDDVPAVVAASGLPAYELLCELLDNGVKQYSVSFPAVDHSDLGLDSVESDDGSFYPHALAALVKAVRSTGEQLVTSGSVGVRDVVKSLLDHEPRIFRRIAYLFLASHPSDALDLVEIELASREMFTAIEMPTEYVLLLRNGFALIPDATKASMLDWLDEPPQWPDTDWSGNPITQDEKTRFTDLWRARRLGPIVEHLDPAWQKVYKNIQSRLRTQVEETGARPQAKMRQPVISQREMSQMTVTEVLAYLEYVEPNYEPSLMPEPRLEETLAKVVAGRVVDFAASAGLMPRLAPSYVQAIMRGLKDGLKGTVHTDWRPMLDLCSVLVNQTPDAPADGRSRPLDEARWTAQAIVEFLAAGLRSNSFKLSERQSVWSLLERLAEHPHPQPDDERMMDDDATTASLNSVRSVAISAAIDYGLWYSRLSKDAGTATNSPSVLSQLPELANLLDRHLDVTVDASLAVRSVYARLYPWLLLLDETWGRTRASTIFPLGDDETSRRYFVTAWASFMRFSRAFDITFEPLRPQYERALELMDDEKLKGPTRLPSLGHYLAEHLMFYLWRGRLELTDSLLTAFWSSATPEVRKHALSFVGDAFRQTDDRIPEEVLERAKRLWTSRMEAAERDDGFKGDLAAFGAWFASAKFDDEWSLNQLEHAAKVANGIDDLYPVMKRLAALSRTCAAQCVAILAKFIEHRHLGTYMDAWMRESEQVLEAALHCGDRNAALVAERLVGTLVDMGYIKSRRLLLN